jgi:hypothetical protein
MLKRITVVAMLVAAVSFTIFVVASARTGDTAPAEESATDSAVDWPPSEFTSDYSACPSPGPFVASSEVPEQTGENSCYATNPDTSNVPRFGGPTPRDSSG